MRAPARAPTQSAGPLGDGWPGCRYGLGLQLGFGRETGAGFEVGAVICLGAVPDREESNRGVVVGFLTLRRGIVHSWHCELHIARVRVRRVMARVRVRVRVRRVKVQM